MKIIIEVIPHNEQRYPTVGDWYYAGNGDLIVRVSELGDWREECLVAVHELVEVLLCKHQGVSQDAVDNFDMFYEKNRQPDDVSEPGDALEAPYRRQHCIATGVERLLAAELDVNWASYESKIEAL